MFPLPTLLLAALALGTHTHTAAINVNCPPIDDDNTPLVSSATAPAGDLVTCTYESAGACTYFPSDGAFSSGSIKCPQGEPQDAADANLNSSRLGSTQMAAGLGTDVSQVPASPATSSGGTTPPRSTFKTVFVSPVSNAGSSVISDTMVAWTLPSTSAPPSTSALPSALPSVSAGTANSAATTTPPGSTLKTMFVSTASSSGVTSTSTTSTLATTSTQLTRPSAALGTDVAWMLPSTSVPPFKSLSPSTSSPPSTSLPPSVVVLTSASAGTVNSAATHPRAIPAVVASVGVGAFSTLLIVMGAGVV